MNINDLKKVFIVGIGGSGMSSLAELLASRGIMIEGSDLAASYYLDKLISQGVKIHLGHESHYIDDRIDCVVYSSAIHKKVNKEILQAIALGIPVLDRLAFLQLLLSQKQTIAVSGIHGKTTTTGMISYLLEQNQLNPSYLIGGILKNNNCSGKWDKGDYLVVEADESEGKLYLFQSYIGIILNMELEHTHHFRSIDIVKDCFLKFADHISKYLIVSDEFKSFFQSKFTDKFVYSFGFDSESDCLIYDVQEIPNSMIFSLKILNHKYEKIRLNMIGIHNVLNAAAAIFALFLLEIDISSILKHLVTFQGMKRRLDQIYDAKNLIIINDYAHHPTEINAISKALKNNYSQSHLVGIFEPHRYSRLIDFENQFIESLLLFDEVWVTDIYSAGEQNNNYTIQTFLNKARKSILNIQYFENEIKFLNHIHSLDQHKILVFMGAGNIYKISEKIKRSYIHATSIC